MADNVENKEIEQAAPVETKKTYKATLTACIKYKGKPRQVGEEIKIKEDELEIFKEIATIK